MLKKTYLIIKFLISKFMFVSSHQVTSIQAAQCSHEDFHPILVLDVLIRYW
jgi:hypothetical protein